MQESSTYMGILNEGKVIGQSEEARQLILRQGQKKFGPPDEAVKAKLAAIPNDLERLECLAERLLDVSSWQELFAQD